MPCFSLLKNYSICFVSKSMSDCWLIKENSNISNISCSRHPLILPLIPFSSLFLPHMVFLHSQLLPTCWDAAAGRRNMKQHLPPHKLKWKVWGVKNTIKYLWSLNARTVVNEAYVSLYVIGQMFSFFITHTDCCFKKWLKLQCCFNPLVICQ